MEKWDFDVSIGQWVSSTGRTLNSEVLEQLSVDMRSIGGIEESDKTLTIVANAVAQSRASPNTFMLGPQNIEALKKSIRDRKARGCTVFTPSELPEVQVTPNEIVDEIDFGDGDECVREDLNHIRGMLKNTLGGIPSAIDWFGEEVDVPDTATVVARARIGRPDAVSALTHMNGPAVVHNVAYDRAFLEAKCPALKQPVARTTDPDALELSGSFQDEGEEAEEMAIVILAEENKQLRKDLESLERQMAAMQENARLDREALPQAVLPLLEDTNKLVKEQVQAYANIVCAEVRADSESRRLERRKAWHHTVASTLVVLGCFAVALAGIYIVVGGTSGL